MYVSDKLINIKEMKIVFCNTLYYMVLYCCIIQIREFNSTGAL